MDALNTSSETSNVSMSAIIADEHTNVEIPKGDVLAVTLTPANKAVEVDHLPYVVVWVDGQKPVKILCVSNESAQKVHRTMIDTLFKRMRRFGYGDGYNGR